MKGEEREDIQSSFILSSHSMYEVCGMLKVAVSDNRLQERI